MRPQRTGTAALYRVVARKTVAADAVTTRPVSVFKGLVRGTVLMGAGRFRGYGLCRMMVEEGEDRD